MYFNNKSDVQCEKLDSWSKNFRDVCFRAYEGETVNLSYYGKPWATLRSVDDGGLPENEEYLFFALVNTKKIEAHQRGFLRNALEKGLPVVIKDSEKRPLIKRNRNIVLVQPFKPTATI